MTTPKNMAEAIRAERMVDSAWTVWAKAEPTDAAPQDEQDAWQAGYAAFEEASASARDVIRDMPVTTLPDVHAKLAWLITEDQFGAELAGFASVVEGLARLLDRPTQDAFAVKLRAYQRAVQDCEAAQAAKLDDDTMRPLYDAVHDSGKAVLLEPAPDVAALIEKRAIFDALQYQDDDENPVVAHRLFADAIALAGGAA